MLLAYVLCCTSNLGNNYIPMSILKVCSHNSVPGQAYLNSSRLNLNLVKPLTSWPPIQLDCEVRFQHLFIINALIVYRYLYLVTIQGKQVSRGGDIPGFSTPYTHLLTHTMSRYTNLHTYSYTRIYTPK